jgi:hypothetical protein
MLCIGDARTHLEKLLKYRFEVFKVFLNAHMA